MATDDPVAELEMLRTLVDHVPSMLAYWDSEQRCRFANRAYERWKDLYPLNLPCIERALRGEPQEFEREIPDPSGGPSRHSLASYIPHVVDGVVCGVFALVTDISATRRAELALEESEATARRIAREREELLVREQKIRAQQEAANEKLRESEERFRLALEEAPIGMALVTLDGHFVRVNRALCEIVGYTADELTGMAFRAITHPDDVGADVALAAQLARGEFQRYQFEKRYVRKDRSIVDVMLSVSVLRDRDGAPRYFISQIEDITERKRLEAELRLAEARSSGILSISADAIISINDDQRITMFNEGAERIFGLRSAEAIGEPLEMLLPERFRAVHRRHVDAFARGGTAARQMGQRGAVIFGVRRNGEEFPADAAISRLDVGGKRVLTVALRDITDQKRIEEEQRFLAEVGPVLATTLDYEETLAMIADLAVRHLADLCIVDIVEEDDDIRRLKVASRDPSRAWICRLLTEIPTDRSRPYLLRSVLETRRPVLLQRPSAELIASFAQNEEHARALRAADIRSMVAVPLVGHAKLLGAIAFVSSTDSRIYGPADLRLAEELAQRAALSIENARLYRTARRATQARDDVLGIVAHDLRNPLSSILLQTEILRRHSTRRESRDTRPVEAIERAATRMTRLIRDLLDVTRLEAGRPLSVEPAHVPAEKVVADSIEAQRTLAKAASLDLRQDVAADLPELWADRDRLLQIFENLIGNALKFTESGGLITVGAAPRDGEVLFWVADTGCGIAEAELPHLFDRFWQSGNAPRLGAGLGLPIVKGVVEAHRGRIWVQSTPGKGSTFFFTIPTPRGVEASLTER